MAISSYMRALRDRIGTTRVLVPAVAAVIRDERGWILLHRRKDNGRWTLPAGAIDPNESPSKAIIREVMEETGHIVEPTRIIGVFGGAPGFMTIYTNGDECEFTVIIFECRVTGHAPEAMDDETLEMKYFSPANLPKPALEYPPEMFELPPDSRPLFN